MGVKLRVFFYFYFGVWLCLCGDFLAPCKIKRRRVGGWLDGWLDGWLEFCLFVERLNTFLLSLFLFSPSAEFLRHNCLLQSLSGCLVTSSMVRSSAVKLAEKGDTGSALEA